MNALNQFNQSAGYNVSNKYKPISTQRVVSILETQGFVVDSIRAGRVMRPERQGFQRHFVKLTHPNLTFKIQGISPYLLLTNSYDATSSVKFMLGTYRQVCSNGLHTGVYLAGDKIRHVGDAYGRVLTALNSIDSKVLELGSQIESWSSLVLNDYQTIQFIKTVLPEVVPQSAELTQFSDADLFDLVRIRRNTDTSNDLFTVMNRLQESVMRYGIRYLAPTRSANGMLASALSTPRLSYRRTRAIRSPNRDVEFNGMLWNKTSEFFNQITKQGVN